MCILSKTRSTRVRIPDHIQEIVVDKTSDLLLHPVKIEQMNGKTKNMTNNFFNSILHLIFRCK